MLVLGSQLSFSPFLSHHLSLLQISDLSGQLKNTHLISIDNKTFDQFSAISLTPYRNPLVPLCVYVQCTSQRGFVCLPLYL